MIKVGLIGYGKAGSAVAQVLQADLRFVLCWVARRSPCAHGQTLEGSQIPLIGLQGMDFSGWLHAHPVDALVDFSVPESLLDYGPELQRTGVAFALGELALYDNGFYTFEDLLMKKLREQLAVE